MELQSKSRLSFVFWVLEVVALLGLFGGLMLGPFELFWMMIAGLLVLSSVLRKSQPVLAEIGFSTCAFALFYGLIGFAITR
jgi:hypothetical protein